MAKKYFIISGSIILLLIIAFSARPLQVKNDKMLKVESVAVNYPSGWGYNILVDHKLFIRQEYIPAIPGNKGFSNKEDAIKTAEFAIAKMIKGKQPAITAADLSSLRVSF